MLALGGDWSVLGSAFLINTFEGVIYCFGLFFVELLQTFGQSRAATAWVGSTMACCLSLVGPLASILIDRQGPRRATLLGSLMVSCGLLAAAFAPNLYVLILSQGVLTGCGLGINCISSFVVIGRRFTNGRCVATAVTSCGSGVGTLAFAPLITWLNSMYGWRGTLMILSGILLHGVALALFYPRMGTHAQQDDMWHRAEDGTRCHVVSRASFILLCSSAVACLFGFYIPYTYLPSYSMEYAGASRQRSALLLSIVGGTNILGRLLLGALCELMCPPSKLFSGALMCGGMATLGWALLPSSFTAHALCAVIFGLTAAASFGVTSLLLVQLLGLKHLAFTFGVLNLVRGLATLGGIPLAGYMMDLIGRMDVCFYISAAAILLSGTLTLPLLCFTNKKTSDRLVSKATDSSNHLDTEVETCIMYAGSHNSLMYVDSMTNLSRIPRKQLLHDNMSLCRQRPIFSSSDNLYVAVMNKSLQESKMNASIGQLIHNVHL